MRLGVTPVPIPNTMVKTQAADGTWLETARESRWLPEHFQLHNTVEREAIRPTSDAHGDVAQLGEHLPCKQGVKSSNLSISIGTTFRTKNRFARIADSRGRKQPSLLQVPGQIHTEGTDQGDLSKGISGLDDPGMTTSRNKDRTLLR